MKWLETIKEAAILSVAAILLGLVVNAVSPAGIPLTGCFDAAVPTADSPFPIMDVSDVKCMIDEGRGVLVDARPAGQYAAGHIPGARPLPLYQMDDYLFPFLDTVEPDIPVIVYCSSVTCEDSHLLAEELADMGYGNVRVFAGGMAAWREKGYAVAVQ